MANQKPLKLDSSGDPAEFTTGDTVAAANLPSDVAYVDQVNGYTVAQQPASGGGSTLGTVSHPWGGIFIGGAGSQETEIVSNATTSRTCTLPDAACNPVQPLGSGTSHEWLSYIDSTGTQNLTQPAFTDISGTASLSQLPPIPNVTSEITQAAHGFSVGNVLLFNGTAYALAKADTAADAEVVGIVSVVNDSGHFTLLTAGYMTGLSGLTAGNTYWLSPTSAGALTVTETTTAGQVDKPLLIADTTTSGWFNNWRGMIVPAAPTTQNANLVYAGPASGAAATPTFRNLVLADQLGLAFNHCRTYLVSGSPYADGSSSGNSTIYFGPCSNIGNLLTLDNGSGVLTTYAVTEISLSITATASNAYDVYVFNNSGTLTLTTTAWTNATTPPTRSTDAAGRLTKSANTDHLLVGAFYAFGTNTTYDCTNAVGSTNVTRRHCCNIYNVTSKQGLAVIAGTWTYSGSTAIRAADANTTDGIGRLSFFQALAIDSFSVQRVCGIGSSVTGTVGVTGFGLDSTTVYTVCAYLQTYTANAITAGVNSFTYPPQLGLHFVQQLESNPSSGSGNTLTFGSLEGADNVITTSVWV